MTVSNKNQKAMPHQQKEKHAGGRPIKFSPELQLKFCDLVRSGVPLKDACSKVGITYQNFFQWRNKGKQEKDLPRENRTHHFNFYTAYLKAETDKKAKKMRGHNFSDIIHADDSETGANSKIVTSEQSQTPPQPAVQVAALKKHKTPVKRQLRVHAAPPPSLDINTLTPYTIFDKTLLKNPFVSGNIFPTDIQVKLLNLGNAGISIPNKKTEALLSGAGWSGKTTALLVAALQYVQVPNYSALLLRAHSGGFSLSDKMENLVNKQSEFIKKIPLPEGFKLWGFPSGAIIVFGYVNEKLDKSVFDKFSYHFIGFDDLTQFTEPDYLYLFDRMEENYENKIPLRIFSTADPSGTNPLWVKKRFIDCPEDEMKRSNRFLLKASIEDNLYVNRANIEKGVRELHPKTQEQLLTGNWD